ncbi:MAG: hypothetical protein ACRDLZ_07855 [Gaiellaceae bacterium]
MSWRIVALLALGIVLEIALTASPATSHVAGWTHNWKKHVRPKADARYLPGGNLPRGRTIRGSYVIRGVSSAAASKRLASRSDTRSARRRRHTF